MNNMISRPKRHVSTPCRRGACAALLPEGQTELGLDGQLEGFLALLTGQH
jgi:hypothetical protein